MRKQLICFLAAVTAGAAFIGAGDMRYQNEKKNGLFPGNAIISVNGQTLDTAGKTPAEVLRAYEESYPRKAVAVTVRGETHQVPLKDCCAHTLTEERLAECRDACGFWGRLFWIYRDFELTDDFFFKDGAETGLAELVEDLPYTKSRDAYFDEKHLKVIPEVYGNQIDLKEADRFFVHAINSGTDTLLLDDERFYVKPQVSEADVKEEYKDLLEAADWHVTYPDAGITISLRDHADAVTVYPDGQYEIDSSFLKDALVEVSDVIDHPLKEVTFTNRNGEEMTIHGGTYGPLMDNVSELKALEEMLRNHQSDDRREPVWKIDARKKPAEWIEVDLSEQHVYHVNNGKICCDSPCVTGDITKSGRATPAGAFFVSEKVPGKYLVGRNNSYRTWVNRWMRLNNDGVGLHDASWRGRFGGSVYKGNGSHGCVNLPAAYARALYDEINVLIPVFVY